MNPLPLVPGLLDTDILRDLHLATKSATDFSERMLPVSLLRFSAVSVLVVACACKDADERELLRLLIAPNRVLQLTAPISRRALAILKELPAPAALSADAALVAATALVHKLPVYTANPGRYANLHGLAAIQPY
jgi:predicted nucleic acid-binding protein